MNFVRSHPILIVFVILVAGICAATAYTLSERQEQSNRSFGGGPALVTVKTAEIVRMTDEIESIGTTLANESVTLTAKVTDTISRVNFEDGQWVDEGDILLELTNAEETAQLAEAQATLEETTRQYHRVKNLIQQRLASETQLDAEKARMETAEARLNAILARLDDRLIRAPFSGLLGFRNVSQGTLMSPNTVITTLDDIRILKLDFTIPEKYLSQIEQGQTIEASSIAWPDDRFVGDVETVGTRVDPVTRSVSVRARLTNEDRKLKPGMLMSVSLLVHEVEVLSVPEESIVPVRDRSYVYRVDDNNVAQRIEVRTGRRAMGAVEIISGLTQGDKVITEGVIKISPGQPVRLREAG